MADRLTIPRSKLKVDVHGSLSGSTGWATHSVNFARALNALTPVTFRAGRRAALGGLLGPLRGALLRSLGKSQADFNVIITGEPKVEPNSVRWVVWETTRLSEAEKEACASTDFLWTPSTWGRDILIRNGIVATRISVVPEGVDAKFFRPSSKPKGRFRFLIVGKWEARKFVDGLVRAFKDEFTFKEDVELYLHCFNPYFPEVSLKQRLESLALRDTDNIILGRPCSMAGLRALYQSASCFVLPSRAEGWGLPILEFMACGVPAIVTRYSAPLDYLDDKNSYLVNVARMVEAHDAEFNIHTGLWAEPDVGHLRHLMRTAFTDRQQLAEKGHHARLTSQQFTWEHAARVALKAMGEHLRPHEDASSNSRRK